MKHLKEPIMSDKTTNQDIKNTAKNVESSGEAIKVVKKKKIYIRSNTYSILWLAYQQVQIFERFKLNDNFLNMVNQYGINDAIQTINEIIVALKIYDKKQII